MSVKRGCPKKGWWVLVAVCKKRMAGGGLVVVCKKKMAEGVLLHVEILECRNGNEIVDSMGWWLVGTDNPIHEEKSGHPVFVRIF